MDGPSLTLVKQAVNRARMLLRLGQLSPAAVKTLRQTPRRFHAPSGEMRMQLPWSKQYSKGLERGNEAMVYKSKGGIVLDKRNATPSTVNMPTRAPGDTITGYLPVSDWLTAVQNNMPLEKAHVAAVLKNKNLQQQLAAVLERHEINEIKGITKGVRQMQASSAGAAAALERSIRRNVRQRFTTHASPNILVEEGKSLVGTHPAVANIIKSIRSQPHMPFADFFEPPMVGAPTPQVIRFVRENKLDALFGTFKNLIHPKDYAAMAKFWENPSAKTFPTELGLLRDRVGTKALRTGEYR